MNSNTLNVQGRIWLTAGNGKPLLGKGRYELLKRISTGGSISKAAKSMKMSYKAAWDAINAINTALGQPVIESSSGGARGGGSTLTLAGQALIAQYETLLQQHQAWLEQVSHTLDIDPEA